MKPILPARSVDQIKEYYFSKRLREVARLNAEGRDIISLGIGGPDRPPMPEVIDTLCEAARRDDSHSYQISVGIPQLRQAYADWYRRHYGVVLNPASEIQPLLGSKEGIIQLMLTFLNPGDGVLVPDPGYPTYTSAARLVEAEVFTYDLTAENHWQPDFEALERLPLDRIKMMWVNYPHMPTGAPASLELFERIVDFGRRHGIVIAHDNPYSFILNKTPLSILQIEGAKEICVELNSLSKSHNMAGWRMAMLASNPEFVSWFIKVKSNIDSGQFLPSMLAAVKALNALDQWYEQLNELYSGRRAIAEQIMTELGCTFDPSQRGMFLWGRIPDSEPSSEQLADRILYDARVFITPGFIFGHNGERYIRLSLCANETNLRRALERIRNYNNDKKQK
ncbi:MAG: aminotransferase class I/II-fold pyridoxal phosphate-dependent enzyme [Bacteroides sp.]|nr:aminotransferase class I/II-fold pyridoxal phosphate-dependent enzyme [Bacteroides sp.]